MVALSLPKNSRVQKGRHHPAPAGAKNVKTFRIYRYDPEGSENPRWDTYDVDVDACGPVVLDVLIQIKNENDPTNAFRRDLFHPRLPASLEQLDPPADRR